MLDNFNTSDFLVFKKEEAHSTPETELPPHILSYDHDTWTGYVRSKDDRQDDEFASYLRSISRG